MSRASRAIILAFLMVVAAGTFSVASLPEQSPLIGVATATDGVQDPTGNLTDSQLFEGTDDGQIEAWERSTLTLRIDNTNAATQIPPPSQVQQEKLGSGNSFTSSDSNGGDGIDSKSLVVTFSGSRNPRGVHSPGSSPTISFVSDRATGGTFDNLNNQPRVEVLAAKITATGDNFPSSFADAVDLLGDIDNANANASFSMVREDVSLDSNGDLEISDESFNAGQYIIYVAVHESGKNGFEVDESKGNLTSVDGDVAIIGLEGLVVQEGATQVTEPGALTPGGNATFTIDTTNAYSSSKDGSLTHVLALYNKTTFENSRMDLVVDKDKLGPNFNVTEDAELESSIGDVSGIADVEDGITLNGVDLSDGRIASPQGIPSVLDFIAEDIGTDPVGTDTITTGGGDNSVKETLYASINATSNNDRTKKIKIEAGSNWPAGTYQYIVFTKGSPVATATGTFEVTESTASASVSVTNTQDTGDIDLSKSQTTQTIKLSFTQSVSGKVSVSELTKIPDNTGGTNQIGSDTGKTIKRSIASYNIDAPNQASTITLTLKKSNLPSDVDFNQLTITRYNDNTGKWEELSNINVNVKTNVVEISGDTSGFSVFSVVETEPSGGGGGGGGGGGAASAQLDISKSVSGNTVSVSVQNAQSGDTATVDLANTLVNTDGDDTGLQSLDIAFSQDSDITLDVTKSQGSAPAITTAAGGLGYFNIDHDASDAAIDSVTFQFRVKKSVLSSKNIDPADVRLYRYNGGSWNELSTTRTGSSGDYYTYEADSPGLSVFAVSATTVQTPTATPTTTAPPTTAPPTTKPPTTGPGTTTGPGVTTTSPPPGTTSPPPTTPPTTQPPEQPGAGIPWIPIIVIIVIVIAAGAYYFRDELMG